MKLKKKIVHYKTMGEAIDIQYAFFALGNTFKLGGNVQDDEDFPGYMRADHNGDLAYGPQRLAKEFPEYEVLTLVDLKKLAEKDSIIPDQSVVSDGGSSSYYQLTITNKAGEYISCEMGDVIRAVVGNDFDLGNVLKAARRMYEASQGRGKKDVSIHYDANKISYFANEFADWNEDKQ